MKYLNIYSLFSIKQIYREYNLKIFKIIEYYEWKLKIGTIIIDKHRIFRNSEVLKFLINKVI